ncbi:MAG: DUF6702 family protein [Flavobacterium sp.]|jgi:hypothetical protein
MTLLKNKLMIYGLIIITLSSLTHKFYVSISQIDYNVKKKQVQITTRYFIDDIENALANKYKEKIYIDPQTITETEKKRIENYIISNYFIAINQKNQAVNYLGYEIENDILIVYLTINNVKKINTLNIKINTLFEILSTQQHIIHTHILEKKCSLLLTEDSKLQECKY